MKTRLETRPPSPPLPIEVILIIVSHVASHSAFSSTHSSSGSGSGSGSNSGFGSAPAAAADDEEEQRTLAAAALVSRAWHLAAVETLYAYPRLTSRNYDAFVRTICPSVNRHVRATPFAALVRVLDLRKLVFPGAKSFVARLLGRVKDNLEVLKAPQTSFA